MSTPLRERPDAPLGTLIFRAGLLPAETIESALQESSRTGKRLGEILLERNLLEEAELSRLLAGQKGLSFVALRERGVDPEAARLFTEDQARLYRALPFELNAGSPTVAISDPTNEVVMRNIREALDGMDVQFAVATRSELTDLIGEIYISNGHGSNGHMANGNGFQSNGASATHVAPPPAVTAEPEPEFAPEPEPAAEPEALPEPTAEAAPAVAPEPVPAPDPEPEPSPAAYAAPQPEPEPEPAPEPAAVPAASIPEPEPVPEHTPEPVAVHPEPVAPATPPEPPPAALRIAPPQPAAPAGTDAPATGAITFRVVIRLTNNDRIEAAVLGDPVAAKAQAKALIRYIAGKDGNDWPYVGGRFLRPDAIVSVDLIEQTAGEAS